MIDTPTGGLVPLEEVAEVAIVPAPNTIKRESTSRRIDITCNARDRDLGSVAREIETRVRQLSFDRGYHPEFLGEYAAQTESKRRILMVGIIALAGIVVLLYSEFRGLATRGNRPAEFSFSLSSAASSESGSVAVVSRWARLSVS